MTLEEEISRHSSVESVVWLLVSLLGVSIMRRSKLNKEKYKVYSLRRKGGSGKCSGVISAQGDERFKSKPVTKWDKGVMTSGQEPSQISSQHVKQS